MNQRRTDMIRLLETELDLIEKGGYGRSVREPGKPTEVFQYSVTCINHWLVPGHKPDTCTGCVLLDFVPDRHREVKDACHHIPLNRAGETVQSLKAAGQTDRLEEVVKQWLRATVKRLKEDAGVDQSAPEVDY